MSTTPTTPISPRRKGAAKTIVDEEDDAAPPSPASAASAAAAAAGKDEDAKHAGDTNAPAPASEDDAATKSASLGVKVCIEYAKAGIEHYLDPARAGSKKESYDKIVDSLGGLEKILKANKNKTLTSTEQEEYAMIVTFINANAEYVTKLIPLFTAEHDKNKGGTESVTQKQLAAILDGFNKVKMLTTPAAAVVAPKPATVAAESEIARTALDAIKVINNTLIEYSEQGGFTIESTEGIKKQIDIVRFLFLNADAKALALLTPKDRELIRVEMSSLNAKIESIKSMAGNTHVKELESLQYVQDKIPIIMSLVTTVPAAKAAAVLAKPDAQPVVPPKAVAVPAAAVKAGAGANTVVETVNNVINGINGIFQKFPDATFTKPEIDDVLTRLDILNRVLNSSAAKGATEIDKAIMLQRIGELNANIETIQKKVETRNKGIDGSRKLALDKVKGEISNLMSLIVPPKPAAAKPVVPPKPAVQVAQLVNAELKKLMEPWEELYKIRTVHTPEPVEHQMLKTHIERIKQGNPTDIQQLVNFLKNKYPTSRHDHQAFRPFKQTRETNIAALQQLALTLKGPAQPALAVPPAAPNAQQAALTAATVQLKDLSAPGGGGGTPPPATPPHLPSNIAFEQHKSSQQPLVAPAKSAATNSSYTPEQWQKAKILLTAYPGVTADRGNKLDLKSGISVENNPSGFQVTPPKEPPTPEDVKNMVIAWRRSSVALGDEPGICTLNGGGFSGKDQNTIDRIVVAISELAKESPKPPDAPLKKPDQVVITDEVALKELSRLATAPGSDPKYKVALDTYEKMKTPKAEGPRVG